MNGEVVKRFLNQHVKICLKNGFLIDGYIREIFEDCIVFVRKGNESVLDLDGISEIVKVSE